MIRGKCSQWLKDSPLPCLLSMATQLPLPDDHHYSWQGRKGKFLLTVVWWCWCLSVAMGMPQSDPSYHLKVMTPKLICTACICMLFFKNSTCSGWWPTYLTCQGKGKALSDVCNCCSSDVWKFHIWSVTKKSGTKLLEGYIISGIV